MSCMKNSLYTRNLCESEVATSLIKNSESWIGIKVILEDFQKKVMLRFCAAPEQGTPIVELYSTMKYMKNRILQEKMLFIGEIMPNKDPNHMCRRVHLAGGQHVKEMAY